MKLGVMTSVFRGQPYEDMLDRVAAAGLDAVEIDTGGYGWVQDWVDVDALLGDDAKLAAWRRAMESRGLELSALACHGNPLHPQRATAERFHDVYRKSVLLAEKLGVPRLTLFSGCPGDATSTYPSWVTAAWPTEFQELVRWQWQEKVIPYWKEQAVYASAHSVRLAFEMHPGMVVYNPETLLKLRAAAGENIGANFDPSHLYWQAIDPVLAIRALGREGCIYHVHAKDTGFDPIQYPLNGVLDTKDMGRVAERSWIFRTVGDGHGHLEWKQFITALRVTGYDDVISIEHEDALASVEAGFQRAVVFLRECLL